MLPAPGDSGPDAPLDAPPEAASDIAPDNAEASPSPDTPPESAPDFEPPDSEAPDAACPDAPASDAPAPDASAGTAVSAMIGSAGGTVVHPSGARLVFPAGALTSHTTITIRDGAAPAARGFRWIGPGFQFEPSGLRFAAPVSLTLPYDPARLGTDPAASISVYHAAGATTAFAPVATTVDTAARTATGTIYSFSQGGAGVPVVDRTIPLSFTPRDLGAGRGGAAGYVWVMGDGTSAMGLRGMYLHRVDVASGAVARWVGESMVFPGLDGPTWTDGWGVWVDASGGQAWFTGQLQNGFAWTVNRRHRAVDQRLGQSAPGAHSPAVIRGPVILRSAPRAACTPRPRRRGA
jgi:hypothetical protein